MIKTQPKLLRRGLATFIDYALYLAFFVWLVTTYGVPDGSGGYQLSDDPKGWWLFIYWVAYFPVAEAISGKTLGKTILGLRVVTKNGNAISMWQAFKRRFFDCIDFFFFGVVGAIVIKNTPGHQRIGDLVANTIVIGSESAICQKCFEQLILTPSEIVNGEFACPACNTVNQVRR